MQIVIEIDEKLRERLFDVVNDGVVLSLGIQAEIVKSIVNGTPLPDNATNGDVIMTLFPNEYDFETDFDEEWWNALYQKGGKE